MKEKKNGIELLGKFRDVDGTEKFVFKTNDGILEITNIKNKENIKVFCLPTHHYCKLGCKFCHLTEHGDSSKEMKKIIPAILRSALIKLPFSANDNILLSFMGVGESFLNINLIAEIYKIFREDEFNNLSLALATMMPTLKPVDFLITEKMPIKIHFSLHSPIDEIRSEIIPSSKIPIEKCLNAMVKYRESIIDNKIIENLSKFHSNYSPVELHYTVIQEVNDSEKELEQLIWYGKVFYIPLKILKFNPTEILARSKKEQYWIDVLKSEYDAPVYMYAPPGPNIGSSCGQFTKHYYLGSNSEKELSEFNAWKEKYQVFD